MAVAAHEIVEAGGVAVEAQSDVVNGTVALLGDQQLGSVVHQLEPPVPALIALVEFVVCFFGRCVG